MRGAFSFVPADRLSSATKGLHRQVALSPYSAAQERQHSLCKGIASFDVG